MIKSIIAILTMSIFFALPQQVNAAAPTYLELHTGDFNSALKTASESGKLLMVDFYADWCQPCKWMDKTTFTNSGVVDMLNSNFVTYKANIDTKDGFLTKEKYGIQFLPTILIFNTKGELVERLESTMAAEKLLPILEFHNHPNNKVKITHQFNSSPAADASPSNTTSSASEDYDLKLLYEEYRRSEKTKSTYRLQVGVYEEYQEAFDKVNVLREEFLEPIVVLNDYRDGKTLYKVMMGEFKSQNEAESFRVILLNSFNIQSIVN